MMREQLRELLEGFLKGEVSLEDLGWELLRLGSRIIDGEIVVPDDVRTLVNDLIGLALHVEMGEATEDEVRAAVERALYTVGERGG